MFIENKDAQEGFIHICEGKTEKQMRMQSIEILKHDVTNYIIIWNESGRVDLQNIRFCPFCGFDLDSE